MNGLIMHSKSSLNLVNKFFMFFGCWILEKFFCGGVLPVVAATSAYEYFNLILDAGYAEPVACWGLLVGK